LSDTLPESVPQPESHPEPQAVAPNPGWKGFLREMVETLGLAVVLFLVINLASARVRVEGSSMLPTLDNGEYVLVSRLSYLTGDYHRGDIIIFRPPMYPEENWFRRVFGFPNFNDNYEDYIKRVIGLPGDQVKVEGGVVYVNDVALSEPYIAAAPTYSGEWTVPDNSLFVLGDNRNNSADSHIWRFVPIKNVLGKALVVYWPFSNWMVLKSGQTALAAP
jgi:signal peptidase I